MKRKTVTARVERSGKWWAITAVMPDGHELFTQARRLGQVEGAVCDVASLADETNRRAAEALRVLTGHLVEVGLSLGEIAQTLGVSKTRAQQLAA